MDCSAARRAQAGEGEHAGVWPLEGRWRARTQTHAAAAAAQLVHPHACMHKMPRACSRVACTPSATRRGPACSARSAQPSVEGGAAAGMGKARLGATWAGSEASAMRVTCAASSSTTRAGRHVWARHSEALSWTLLPGSSSMPALKQRRERVQRKAALRRGRMRALGALGEGRRAMMLGTHAPQQHPHWHWAQRHGSRGQGMRTAHADTLLVPAASRGKGPPAAGARAPSAPSAGAAPQQLRAHLRQRAVARPGPARAGRMAAHARSA